MTNQDELRIAAEAVGWTFREGSAGYCAYSFPSPFSIAFYHDTEHGRALFESDLMDWLEQNTHQELGYQIECSPEETDKYKVEFWFKKMVGGVWQSSDSDWHPDRLSALVAAVAAVVKREGE